MDTEQQSVSADLQTCDMCNNQLIVVDTPLSLPLVSLASNVPSLVNKLGRYAELEWY